MSAPTANMRAVLEQAPSAMLSMLDGAFMSRANSIVCSGEKLDLAMQLIFTPLIHKLMDLKRRAS